MKELFLEIMECLRKLFMALYDMIVFWFRRVKKEQ
jgi:hypothetical protein